METFAPIRSQHQAMYGSSSTQALLKGLVISYVALDIDPSDRIFTISLIYRPSPLPPLLIEFTSTGVRKSMIEALGAPLAVDGAGNIWLGGGNNHTVKKYDQGGSYLGPTITLPGVLVSVVLDADASAIYIIAISAGIQRLLKYTLAGALQWNVGVAQLGDFVVTGGVIYSIRQGVFLYKYSATNGASLGSFAVVNSRQIAFDSSGNLWLTTTGALNVNKYSIAGVLLDTYPVTGAQFLSGITIDSNDNVYISDLTHKSIHKLDSAGNYITHWH